MQSRSIKFKGGLDLTTPRSERHRKAGSAVVLENYFSSEGGYRRLEGWERYDGRTPPSRGGDRGAIGEVPGDGPLLGMFRLREDLYAMRATGTGVAASTSLYRATSRGWRPVSLGTQVQISGSEDGALPQKGGWVGTGQSFGEVVDAWRAGGKVRAILRSLSESTPLRAGDRLVPRPDVAYWQSSITVPGAASPPLYPFLTRTVADDLAARIAVGDTSADLSSPPIPILPAFSVSAVRGTLRVSVQVSVEGSTEPTIGWAVPNVPDNFRVAAVSVEDLLATPAYRDAANPGGVAVFANRVVYTRPIVGLGDFEVRLVRDAQGLLSLVLRQDGLLATPITFAVAVRVDVDLEPTAEEAGRSALVEAANELLASDLPARDWRIEAQDLPGIVSGAMSDPDRPGLMWVFAGGRAAAFEHGARQRFNGGPQPVTARPSPGDGFALEADTPYAGFGSLASSGCRWVYSAWRDADPLEDRRRLRAYPRDTARDLSLVGHVADPGRDDPVVGAVYGRWGVPVDLSTAARRAYLVTRSGRVSAFTMPAAGAPRHLVGESFVLGLPAGGVVDAVWSDNEDLLFAADLASGRARAYSLSMKGRVASGDVALAAEQQGAGGAACDGMTAWLMDLTERRAYAYGVAGRTYRYEEESVAARPDSRTPFAMVAHGRDRAWLGTGQGGLFTGMRKTGLLVAERAPYLGQWTEDPSLDFRLAIPQGAVRGAFVDRIRRRTLWVLHQVAETGVWRLSAFAWPVVGRAPAPDPAQSFDVPVGLFDDATQIIGMAGGHGGAFVLHRTSDGQAHIANFFLRGKRYSQSGSQVFMLSNDVSERGGIAFARDGEGGRSRTLFIAAPSLGKVLAYNARVTGDSAGQREPALDITLPAALRRRAGAQVRGTLTEGMAGALHARDGGAELDVAVLEDDVTRIYAVGTVDRDYLPFPAAIGWDDDAGVVVAEHLPPAPLHDLPGVGEMRAVLGNRALVLRIGEDVVRLPFQLAEPSGTRATATGRRAVRFEWAPPGQAARGALEGLDPGDAVAISVETVVPEVEGAPAPAFQGGTVASAPRAYRMPALATEGKRPAAPRLRTITSNFSGQAGTTAIYGVTGTTQAFVFDGSSLTWIESPLDALGTFPSFVAEHAQHLVLGYREGSILISGLQRPDSFRPTDGAEEIATGDTITDMYGGYRSALFVVGRSSTRTLKGTSSEDFELDVLSSELGAVEGSLQPAQRLVCLDDRGLRVVDQSDAYGDFATGTLSNDIDPLIDAWRETGMQVTTSFRVRSKSAYVVCFAGGECLVATWVTRVGRNGAYQAVEFSTLRLPATVTYAITTEDPDGRERVFFAMEGHDHVYEMGVGTSADGDPVQAHCVIDYDDFNKPNMQKAYRVFQVAAASDEVSTVYLKTSFDDGEIDRDAARGLGVIDSNARFDIGRWNQISLSRYHTPRSKARIHARGRNVSLLIASARSRSDAPSPPHTLASAEIQYMPRGEIR